MWVPVALVRCSSLGVNSPKFSVVNAEVAGAYPYGDHLLPHQRNLGAGRAGES